MAGTRGKTQTRELWAKKGTEAKQEDRTKAYYKRSNPTHNLKNPVPTEEPNPSKQGLNLLEQDPDPSRRKFYLPKRKFCSSEQGQQALLEKKDTRPRWPREICAAVRSSKDSRQRDGLLSSSFKKELE